MNDFISGSAKPTVKTVSASDFFWKVLLLLEVEEILVFLELAWF